MTGSIHDGRDPLIGLQINGFVIERCLAKGGMGAIYVAGHARFGHIRKAIKVLLPEYAETKQYRRRFEREAEAVSKLRHDHILEVDDFGALPDGQLWLMTPFLEGQPLDEFLRVRRRVGEHRALLILLQLLSALEYAHKRGIVHRDLKPGNVFMCPTQKQPLAMKLLDFGVAKILGDADAGLHTQAGAPVGTPCYMAVEQYERADEATPRADLYAVGVMVCEMVTGRLPWGRHDRAVQYHKQRTERPVLDGLSPGWTRVVEAALAVEPRDRPESAQALAVALASETPAISPQVPSGAEMLRTVAPELGQHVPPDGETVRNQASRELVAPLSWSTLAPPEAPPGRVVTTLGAATGALSSQPSPIAVRSGRAIAGLGACGLVVAVAVALARPRATEPAIEVAPAALSPPPDAPPVDAVILDAQDAVAAPVLDAVKPGAPARVPRIQPPRPAWTSPGPRRSASDEDAFDPNSPTGR